ncbi:MAG: prepilin-type N-terminal cleavage/methylation domain-containing protein [Acidobacteriota bacterium]|nr:MAG: prepilin-type N-terminal cleavage/methylation domain-containing protein [Acidobacteriota bacterium]
MKTMQTSPRGRSTGFTLFELLVVLILVGAASAVVVTSFTAGFGSIQLETSTRDLITHMRRARSDAVTQQAVRRIIFFKSEDPYSTDGYVFADDYGQQIDLFSLPRGISFQEEGMTGEISFYPNGRSSGGTVSLVSEKGKGLIIDVDPITGFGKLRRGDPDL